MAMRIQKSLLDRHRDTDGSDIEISMIICPECNHHIPLETSEQRFWSKVNKLGPIPENKPCEGPCWLWNGERNLQGYGKVYKGDGRSKTKKVIHAHRSSWIFQNGSIPEGLVVRHRCDIKACVNPNHLELGTDADNMRDLRERGKGDNMPNSGMTGVICPACNHHILLQTREQKFFSKVDKQGPLPGPDKPCSGPCWTWCGNIHSTGYGIVSYRNKGKEISARAHRVSWEYANLQEIPEGLVIRHCCDNPTCVNPQHLMLGTHADNNRDMVERGRANYFNGEDLSHSILTEEQVITIRIEYSTTIISVTTLAKKYGISHSAMGSVCRGENWKHVERIPQQVSMRDNFLARSSKLTKEQVLAIRADRAAGMALVAIALKYGTTFGNVSGICLRKSWKDI